ncbi:MAG TPA: hypothetical protein VFJ02_21040 [Vicinamibacterales bacterium]|nr:hypothetical protein [Vicinamibacterales bacterium]
MPNTRAGQPFQSAPAPAAKLVFWHRELPPLDAVIAGEHTIEAASRRVPGTIDHRDDLWNACYKDLMEQARVRIEQEVDRLGGDYAHVFDEAIDPCRDDAKGETWLRGRFSYVLFRSQRHGSPATTSSSEPRTASSGVEP